MTMKQTQTKQYAYSDVGLDFSSGSTQKFPDVFKKILGLGYNEQTVSSVAVTGNQVVLTYGVSHGYVADRVLKITSGALAAINNGEFWIDSVTTNTVTMTIDGAPISVAGGFATKIASLGWILEYELDNIHVYKFKHIDNTDLYARFCFTQTYTHRNRVAVCIGKTFDVVTGFINDSLSLESTRSISNPVASVPCMQFSSYGGNDANTHSTYTSAQGVSIFGSLGVVVGSKYHVGFMGWAGDTSSINFYINGIFPASTLDYDNLSYPCFFGCLDSSVITSNGSYQGLAHYYAVGNLRVFTSRTIIDTSPTYVQNAYQSYLGAAIDAFNTTTCEVVMVREYSTGQYLGEVLGLFSVNYGASNTPSIARSTLPQKTKDISLEFDVYTIFLGTGQVSQYGSFFAIPAREIV